VLALTPRPDGALDLRVLCQHGTYVKEWISGDEERTTPSLAKLLGVPSKCRVLDVEEILTDDVPGERLPKPPETKKPDAKKPDAKPADVARGPAERA
jgi:hypothetical protein